MLLKAKAVYVQQLRVSNGLRVQRGRAPLDQLPLSGEADSG